MKKVKIEQGLKYNTKKFEIYIRLINNIIEKNIIKLKYFFYSLLLLLIIIILLIDIFYLSNIKIISLKPFKKYVNDCKRFKSYNLQKIKKDNPFLSVCLSALNMEKYIVQNLLSILNQSFQDFEIIIVNDNSKDNTKYIINKMQLKDDRIKIVNHNKNLGVYRSRMESILNAKGKYIILMDPDDMFLNENLFKELYNYNININIDITEFSVFQQIEGRRKIFFPNNHFENHYHNFSKNIIYQPELSNLLYYLPGTKEYSHTICRNIWNKMINKKIFLNMYDYLGIDYYNQFIITADDMLMNIIIYEYAKNYSNIELPGYLYNIRKVSMSRGDGGIELHKIRTINHYYYFKIFYKYIKEFNKDRNYLFYEMKNLNHYILYIKDFNLTKFIKKEIKIIKEIRDDKYISSDFKNYSQNLLLYFEK